MSEPRILTNRWRISKTTANWAMDQLFKYVDDGSINLSPPYQRGLVWTPEQQVKLIDSVMTGIGIPPIYLNELDSSQEVWLEVLDGKQRITALMAFMRCEFSYDGLFYRDFTLIEKRKWAHEIIPINKVYGLSHAEALEVFDRINFCGVPHTKPLG